MNLEQETALIAITIIVLCCICMKLIYKIHRRIHKY